MTDTPVKDKSFVAVNGRQMAYVEIGEGRPIVFLHGNPTSSYLWRDVMPALVGQGRCIAPDLIGMGDSDKLPEPDATTYTFETHSRYLDGFMQALGLERDVTLVVHDWGSALGFDWANRHRDAVRAIAYMEGIVRPLETWAEFSPEATPLFQALRSEAGEGLILDRNVFIEKILPGSILRGLSDAEMTEYRRPFLDRDARWPTLTWPRQIPIAGDPPDVVARVAAYAEWLKESDLPKCFVNAEPGAILTGAARAFCRTWKNQHEVTVAGSHFIQEDSGAEIGRHLSDWLRSW
ncbi:haloalkane dehalogenase [Cognatishimia sp. F0-27]|uniref:haloalkane dehalogenase n=1 Tax=Cognatishimia sp. F0-27 TaxID=2816855 RepID=UPI001D0C4725|nr:haloalkane dehalogenase [Cognatishimia sp. F0-27]MCC1493624.1 haloalkane dehalogenase [Cognatishimia sp. F0-27]